MRFGMNLNRNGVEQFLRSDFVRMDEGRPSKLLDGRKQASQEAFNCPRCGVNNPPPALAFGQCQCGLEWIAHGNILYLWTAESIGEAEPT